MRAFSADKAWRISWLSFRGDYAPAASGWKLHVSAAYPEAADILAAYGSAFIELGCPFKLPCNARDISTLNSGLCGTGQVGKVITAYPSTIERLKHLLAIIPAVPRSTITPIIMDEPSLICNPRIHVRFGQIRLDIEALDQMGRPKRRVSHPVLGVVDDQRSIEFVPLSLLEQEGVEFTLEANFEWDDQKWLEETHCLPAKVLASSSKGTVVLALDVQSVTPVVIKRARIGVVCDALGNDAKVRLRNEARFLTELDGSDIAPTLLFEQDTNGILAMEDLGGPSMGEMKANERWALLPSLLRALSQLHENEIVHRDVKLDNFVWSKDGKVRLIDFELSAKSGEIAPVQGGTNGVVPLEGTAATAHRSYDMVGLASILFHCATDSNPALLPGQLNHRRQRAILSRLPLAGLKRLHTACGNDSPPLRPESSNLTQEIEEIVQTEAPISVSDVIQSLYFKKFSHRYFNRHQKRMLIDAVSSLSATNDYLIRSANGHVGWVNVHAYAGHACRGINLGAGGILLACIAARKFLGVRYFDETMLEVCESMVRDNTGSEAVGLFTGETGGLLATCLTALHLDQPDLFRCAKARFIDLGNRSFCGDDLFSGSAGFLYACALMLEISRDEEFYFAGLRIARALIAKAEFAEEVPLWRADPEYDDLQRQFLGVAHGAAGILMALRAFAEAQPSGNSEDEIGQFARRGLVGLADLCLAQEVIGLPEYHGGDPRSQRSWCHGLGGVLWALCQFDHQIIPPVDLERIARAWVKHLPLVDNPTMCHGFGGTIETLRMLKLRTGDRLYGDLERYYLLLGEATKIRRKSGTVWSSEEPVDVTPDLWVGFSGVSAQFILSLKSEASSVLSSSALSCT
jgi:hypothetical protein